MDYKKTDFNQLGQAAFPGYIGIEVMEVSIGVASGRMEIKPIHFAPNGFVHAGSIITLADTIAGYGCLYNLPERATSFTTLELKSNFIGSARKGYIIAEGTLQHVGKTTQVWDVSVKSLENQKTIALFRCTQLILY